MSSEWVRAVAFGVMLCGGGALAQTGPPSTVLKANSQTVLIDVVVLDRGGHPLMGLKKQDFTVQQDGTTQPLTFFQTHTGTQGQARPQRKLPEGMYSNFPAEVNDDALNVVLLDALNTPTQDQMTVRKQMISYLQLLPPDMRIAIFTLISHLRMINGFTTDPAALLHALAPSERIRASIFRPC